MNFNLSLLIFIFGIIGFMSHSKFVIHSRREYMFIGEFKVAFQNPEGIVCNSLAF